MCSCTWQFFLEHKNQAQFGRTNIEQIYRHQHDEIYESEDDKDPKRDRRDQIWHDLTDDTACDGEGHCGERCAFGTGSEGEHFRGIHPAVTMLLRK